MNPNFFSSNYKLKPVKNSQPFEQKKKRITKLPILISEDNRKQVSHRSLTY